MKQHNISKHTFTLRSVVLLLLLAAGMAGCKKSFLDVTPLGVQLIQTVNDYDQLLDIPTFQLGYNTAEVMGDEVVAADPWLSLSSSVALQYVTAFEYQANVFQPAQTAPEMQGFMVNLYTYNKVINEVMSASDSADDPEHPSAIRAEALADRAWSYMWLINYWATPYNPTTAATDPGYPIITVADVTASGFTRASVQDVYRFIINDLTSAIPDLPVTVTNRFRMSKPAAEAILGKTYWFMAQYDSAFLALDAAIQDLGQQGSGGLPVSFYNLAKEMTPAGLYAYNPFSSPFLYIIGNTNGNLNQEMLFSRPYLTANFDIGYALLSASEETLFTASDYRMDFFSPYGLGGAAPMDTHGDLRRIGPWFIDWGIGLPDLYLMHAECAARTGNAAAAISDLQALRINRMSASDAVVPGNLTQQQLIQFVLDERIREFACMGFRWFDMRRLSTDPQFSGATYAHTYYSTSGTQTFTLQQPDRFTLRFPQNVIDENPGMVNNP